MALGKNVQKRREQLNLTQTELGARVGVSQTAIALLESRDSKSSRNIDKLVEALETTHEDLATGNFEKLEGRDHGTSFKGTGDKRLDQIVRNLLEKPESERADILRAINILIPKKV